MLRGIWRHRQLVLVLTRRQYQLRYRQSMVGALWAFAAPLATLGVAIILFDKVVGVETGSAPYPLFALSALVPWTFFASSLTLGVQSVSSAQSLVTRLAFPRMALPLSTIGASFIDLGVAAFVFVVFSLVMGIGLPITAVWFPVLVVLEALLVSGIVLLTSALNVFSRDIKLAVPFVAQLWLFVTPVMYPLESVPSGLRTLYLLNPMTGIVESSRQLLVFGTVPTLELMVSALVGAAILLLVGFWYFVSVEPRFADVI